MKKKKEYEQIKHIFSLMNTHITSIIGIVFCILLTSAVSFLQPLIVKYLTDNGILIYNIKVIIIFSLLILLFAVLQQLFQLIERWMFVGLQNRIQQSLYEKAFAKLLSVEFNYFTDKNSAEIINQISTDIQSISGIADNAMLFTISYLLSIIGGTVGLLLISWEMTVIVLLFVPIKAIIVKILSKKQHKIIEDSIYKSRKFSAWLSDCISGIVEIRLWGLQRQSFKEFKYEQDVLLKNNKNISMISAYDSAFNSLLDYITIALLYIVGGYALITNKISVGGLFAFISYSSYITGPISSLFQIRYILVRIFPSSKRFLEFLSFSEEQTGYTIPDKNVFKSISFCNVSFEYEKDSCILDKINLTINDGDKIAIIGANGSGKTTILNLILKLYDPCDGEIFFNQTKIKEFNVSEYRKLFSVVTQNPFLFKGDVKENIDLSNGHDDFYIENTLIKSGIKLNSEELRLFLKCPIGNDGKKLSGGERQKIAVARAITRNAPIILLDEATSSYDHKSSQQFYNSILSEFSDKTVICIAHSEEVWEQFDKIYYLDNGNLALFNQVPQFQR